MSEGTRQSWSASTTDQKVGLATKLYGEGGGSAGEIAGRLSLHLREHISRNAIIGLWHRNPDLKKSHPFTGERMSKSTAKSARSFPLLPREPREPREPRPPKPKKQPASPPPTKRELMKIEQERRIEGEPESRMLPLLELESGDCRWPTADAVPGGASFRFCGHSTAPGSSFCPHHHSRAWVPHLQRKANSRA